MDLVCELLDKQVVDRNGRELGRVDSIVFQLRDDGPPIVSAIEIGLVTVSQRLHPFLGRCARALEIIAGVEADRPVRVPFAKITEITPHIKLDLTSSDINTLAFEETARAIVSAIPGA
jgi:sporulation protein YlmC with PRC-barrel domain